MSGLVSYISELRNDFLGGLIWFVTELSFKLPINVGFLVTSLVQHLAPYPVQVSVMEVYGVEAREHQRNERVKFMLELLHRDGLATVIQVSDWFAGA
jgi:hypothetical protein